MPRAAPSTEPIGQSPSPEARAAGATWRLQELVGRGSSAEVWRAVDERGREIALKRVRPELRGREGARELLRVEHERLVAFRHAHVVRTFGLVEHDGAEALALEYLDGGDLVSLLGSAPRHWLRTLREAFAAVAHVNALGFVHGDLKARNVLLAADGSARLVDFAAARAPQPDVGADGPPARWTGAGECAAFATIVYELIAGRPPFALRGGGLAAEPLPVPSVPPAVADLLATAVEALRARGRVAGGLSVFEDVIESALADASNS